MPNRGSTIFKRGRARQRGAALLIMLAILLVGIAAVLINSLTAVAAKNARQEKTAAALAQAKDALIGFAVTYGDTHSNTVPGYLPCPDTDGTNGLQSEGVGEYGTSSCNSSPSTNQDVSVIGRLPWATLDVSDLRDGNGECLWYAVSGTYKNNPPTGLMNWDTNGQFQIYAADGTLLASQVVAVIFAPGASSSPSQDRSPDGTAPICGGNYTASNYLDSGTVNSIAFNNANITTGKFIQGTNGGTINDQMVFITRQDIWNAVQKRTDFKSTDPNINPLKKLTDKVADCLVKYANNNTCSSCSSNDSLPWPAPLALSDYADSTQYDDTANLYAGRVPYSVNASRGPWPHHNSLATLMNGPSCGSSVWTASVDAWWTNWKDQLFYGLAGDFYPTNGGGQHCGGFSPCLSLNGGGQVYAGVVMFAGPRLANQGRATKSDVTQYLEGSNATNVAGPNPPTNGNEDYQSASASINDVLCTIYFNSYSSTFSVNCP
jgi:type II secretory pathway pseudopilin PulG